MKEIIYLLSGMAVGAIDYICNLSKIELGYAFLISTFLCFGIYYILYREDR